MKNIIELKYHKNSKQEIVFLNLNEIKENDNVVLRLKDGDLTPLLYLKLPYNVNLFIPHINKQIIDVVDNLFGNVNLYSLDNDLDTLLQGNVLPKWNIPEDSAVLFLSEEDKEKYQYVSRYENNIACFYNLVDGEVLYDAYGAIYSYDGKWQEIFLKDHKNEEYEALKDEEGCVLIEEKSNLIYENYIRDLEIEVKDFLRVMFYNNSNNIYLIIPQLHAEDKDCKYHIENINKVCKELKEKYGVERVELFVSHCFVDLYKLLCFFSNEDIKADCTNGKVHGFYFNENSWEKPNIQISLKYNRIERDLEAIQHGKSILEEIKTLRFFNFFSQYKIQEIKKVVRNGSHKEKDEVLEYFCTITKLTKEQAFWLLKNTNYNGESVSEFYIEPVKYFYRKGEQEKFKEKNVGSYFDHSNSLGDTEDGWYAYEEANEKYEECLCVSSDCKLFNYTYDKPIEYINKITTTNSTDILEVQDSKRSERLKVIDCVEFFKEHLDI